MLVEDMKARDVEYKAEMLNLQRKAKEEEQATLRQYKHELEQRCRYKDVACWKERFLMMMALPKG